MMCLRSVAVVSRTKPTEEMERLAIEELLRSIKSIAEAQRKLVELAESILAESRKDFNDSSASSSS